MTLSTPSDSPPTRDVPATPIESIGPAIATLRRTFDSGRTRPYAWRRQQLEGIDRMLVEKEAAILEAVLADLGKPDIEAFVAEVSFVRAELGHMVKKLRKWMKPERVRTPITIQPGSSSIHREPLGVALIIGPWNYPLMLVLSPLLGALAAGNCAVVKPSELSSATSALLARYLPLYVDPEAVLVVEGGVDETTALLAERFDHIFYTGNGAVGRIVMTAAARHLTPVTLELGGKSPCIVDRSLDLDVAARRIVWGKFYNAGQTCVAPDFVLAHRDVHDRLLDRLTATIEEFYGPDPRRSPDFGRIINTRHHRRLARLLASGRTVAGGDADEAERYIAPTVLADVSPEDPVMGEEIFGPILPVLAVDDIDEAIAFVNRGEKPLALYVFTDDRRVADDVLARTSSGGASVNHTWLHLSVPGLPFGGVGESGMGAYHGRATFETFCHRKGVLRKPTAIDPPILYPPFTPAKKSWLRRLL